MEKPKREEVRRHIQNLADDYKCWDERLSYEEALVLCDMLDKLAEYEDLEGQGKLLKLPCVVGDKLFVINKNRNNLITEENVYDVQYRGEKYAKGQRFFMNIGALAYFEMDFGKTVFPTREEAEAALERSKNETD